MTARRVTLTRHLEHIDGRESRADLVVRLVSEPATRWEPGCNDIEPDELFIDGEPACIHDHAALVNEILEMEPIPAVEEYER